VGGAGAVGASPAHTKHKSLNGCRRWILATRLASARKHCFTEHLMTVEAPQLVAICLIHDAGSFVECARLVDQHLKGGVPTYPRFSSPVYFLLCHAIELALKAHLAASGVPTRTLRSKKLGHKIDVAFRYARRCFAFAFADNRFPELVNWLAPYHQVHVFRPEKPGVLICHSHQRPQTSSRTRSQELTLTSDNNSRRR
jgi:hypothetical protein